MDSTTTLREIRNKNHFVFKQLFEDLYSNLVIYANGYLFDRSSGEDVVQEVFVYLWENSEKIDITSNLKSYLYAMVRNRCLNILKSIKVTDSAKVLELQAIFDSDYSLDSIGNEDKNLLYDQVIGILEGLPIKMRTIVKLRFVDNYKYSEIADELGLSVNTVKTQLKRAKIKFGKLMVLLAFVFLI